MVVVVGGRTPIWPIFAVLIIVVLVVVAILLFILTGGRGTLLVVAIPGFPVESIILGVGLGVLLVLLKRKPASNNNKSGTA
ncbi:MAG: hypothetical protein ABSD49_05700 [Candidatus Bathyarchaeia archaeon]